MSTLRPLSLAVFLLIALFFVVGTHAAESLPVLRLTYKLSKAIPLELWNDSKFYFSPRSIINAWKTAGEDIGKYQPEIDAYSTSNYFPDYQTIITEITFRSDNPTVAGFFAHLQTDEGKAETIAEANKFVPAESEYKLETIFVERVDVPVTCADKVRNGDETDVDCGGSCARCSHDKKCSSSSDCGPVIPPTSECSGENRPVECDYKISPCVDGRCRFLGQNSASVMTSVVAIALAFVGMIAFVM